MNRYAKAFICAATVASIGGCVAPVSTSVIERYLDGAEHLTEAQRESFSRGRPFVGMTIEEANVAMVPGAGSATLNGQLVSGIFHDRRGRKYELDFGGTPAAVIAWRSEPGPEIELQDIDDLRPEPPFGILR